MQNNVYQKFQTLKLFEGGLTWFGLCERRR